MHLKDLSHGTDKPVSALGAGGGMHQAERVISSMRLGLDDPVVGCRGRPSELTQPVCPVIGHVQEVAVLQAALDDVPRWRRAG